MREELCPGCGADHVDDRCRECQDEYCGECLKMLPVVIGSRSVDFGPLCPTCHGLVATVTDSAGRTIAGYKLERDLPYKCGACNARFLKAEDCTEHIRICTSAAYLLGAVDTGIAVVAGQ
jgi:hypothetical protein